MARRKGGFIGHDGLNAPDSPTGVSGSAGDTEVDVSFTAPSDVGGSAITGYRVQDGTGAHGASGSSSPITVTGLTNGTSYTFNVWAINAFGYSAPSDASESVSPSLSPKALVALGVRYAGSYIYIDRIDNFIITTTGNASDFGDLTAARGELASASSAARGIFAGGQNGSSHSNVIDYVTIASAGNATDFGDLSAATDKLGGLGNSTRGVFHGGNASGPIDEIQYITIASTGDATDFGNLLRTNEWQAGTASTTRGMIGGGSYDKQVVQYITIASTGDATDFGDLFSVGYEQMGACSNGTRAVFGGGNGPVNTIQYFTIATLGDYTDFGDLTQERRMGGGTAGDDRGLFMGGAGSFESVKYNTIDYITISSAGNATDFGNLTRSVSGCAACSSAHGGLS